MASEIELTVADALVTDSGRSIARIDTKSRQDLDLLTGDIVELKRKGKSTAAVVWQAHPSDEGLGFIRIDGYLRQNLGVGIGDKIFVSKATIKDAEKVILAPPPGQKPPLSPDFAEYAKRRLENRPIVKGDSIPIPMFGLIFNFLVIQVLPHGITKVTRDTKVIVKEEPVSESQVKIAEVHYEDIGGLDDVKQKIREMVELPIRYPELFERLGIEPPKGVLLYGPPGTGKTLLAKAVANESDVNFISISGPELVSKFVGESEEKLREIFKSANEKAPTILFMDEIDAIAPKREESTNEVERRMVSQLLTLMDGMAQRGQVIVLAATNRPDAIDPALRRPGRFDREIEIGVPNRDARKQILQVHTRHMPISKDVNVDELANMTHGYTGADITALVREAAMSTLRRFLPQILDKQTIPNEILEKLYLTRDDFIYALKSIQPSALREVFIERPNVHWNDVGGLNKAKEDLKEAIDMPLKYAEDFAKMGIRPIKGILLVGPPGTGKTLLAKAIATERETNFIAINGPEVLNKFVGESERTIREIFRKARLAAPCIIFIDEIDSITNTVDYPGGEGGVPVAERVVATLLTEMDGLEESKNVFVLAATNSPEKIEPALLRAGRFDKIIEIPMPDGDARLEIFKIHTKRMPLDKDVDLGQLADETENYTSAEIENICREAGMNAIRNKKDIVNMKDFDKALKEIKPSIPKEVSERIKRFKDEPESMYR
ncbi:MAG: CDC48 family AAA ATPase [Candidatus Micrarchaeota archaeon]|nr:CDC48 family AAA ATPase [Candidatus Micrarchaeota archaeon]MDE1824027.1 CDC48 family AAA ATPase [Candidatus Micrarchaeota archaeon]MDE1849515.1 CDC48 family AAA ATPase [Candidatus Micrarchaeota archaeon]